MVNREQLEASSSSSSSVSSSQDSGRGQNKSSLETNAHALEGHRQTMAGVVPQLYQLLSNAVEAEDARELGAEGKESDRSAVTEDIRAALHEVPWLWVGDAFVPADQASYQGRVCLYSGMHDGHFRLRKREVGMGRASFMSQ